MFSRLRPWRWCFIVVYLSLSAALSILPSFSKLRKNLAQQSEEKLDKPPTRNKNDSFSHLVFGILIGSASGTMMCPYHFNTAAYAAAPAVSRTWQLGNGDVQFPENLSFESSSQNLLKNLHNPRLLGSGGGGAVFALRTSNINTVVSSQDPKVDDEVVVKISWVQSSDSVKNECSILNKLEKLGVKDVVEICLGEESYPYDNRRTMIALRPVADSGAVASASQIDPALQQNAVHSIAHTFVQFLEAGIITTDVQPLISPTTGKVLFIDLTEAQDIEMSASPSTFSGVSSFCSEMLALIPDELQTLAVKIILSELQNMHSQHLHPEVQELVKEFIIELQ